LRVTVIGASIVAACLCIRWPDARALENRLKGEPAPASQPFRVAEFVAEPLVFLPGGRALPFIMPVALSTRFELSVEVLASSSDLAKIHIAGQPLGPVRLSSDRSDPTPSASGDAETWHQIRLGRHGDALALWVDGRKIPTTLKPEATSTWLTFEPGPERPSHFRNLVVAW
jgi:hypothetical protein